MTFDDGNANTRQAGSQPKNCLNQKIVCYEIRMNEYIRANIGASLHTYSVSHIIWAWNQKIDISTVDKRENTSAEKVHLYLNDKLLGKHNFLLLERSTVRCQCVSFDFGFFFYSLPRPFFFFLYYIITTLGFYFEFARYKPI